MKIKKIGCLLAALSVISIFGTVYAANYSVSYWYSDSSDVLYSPESLSYYVAKTTGCTSAFTTTIDYAIAQGAGQWNSILKVNIFASSQTSALTFIYCGPYGKVKEAVPKLAIDDTGITVFYYTSTGNTVTYQSAIKNVYKFNIGTKIGIVQQENASYDTNRYKNTALHELGHFCGWYGHSSSSSDVMYAYNTTVTTLTTRDKNHLSQIYNLFY